jgi:SPP1 family predicted phage head-tail adaptor
MRIAARDRRIIILQATFEKNAAREMVATGWEPYARPWAAFAPVSDGERLRAAAVEQKSDARFVVSWSARLAAITSAFRLRFDGDDWRITGIKELGFRNELEITAWRLKKAGG